MNVNISMKRYYLLALFICQVFAIGNAQCGLQSGPMNGYSDMLEAMVWVQTKCPQQVQMRYWLDGKPEMKWESAVVTTDAMDGYTGHLLADQVTPGNTYEYEILIDKAVVKLPYKTSFKTQSLWQYRTDPRDFTFVAGSCVYINEPAYDRPGNVPYGGDYHIFNSIHHDDPDLMIWLGDNTYLREVDWNTRTGIYHRYTHSRSLPEMQPLLARAQHYAVWDDHDYGPNDSDRSFWMKDMTREAFMDFWANPNYGVGNTEGITGTFTWEDCQFFLMDDRWYRAAKKSNGDYYGQKQLSWLLDALRFSSATYKFICTGGQVLSDAAIYENYAQFPAERQALLDSIDKYNIKGVVFLTGDRHHSEISRMQTADGNYIYDLTCSALTSTTTPHPDEPNHHRLPGTMIGVRNYTFISITGPRTDRVCKVIYKDSKGDVLLEHEIEK